MSGAAGVTASDVSCFGADVNAAIPPRFDHPWAIVFLGTVVVAMVALAIWGKLTEGRRADPGDWSWRDELLEPWGTIVLATWFVVTPIAVLGGRWLGGWIIVVLVPACSLLFWRVAGGSNRIREITVDADGVEIRTLRGRRRVPLGVIVAVTEPKPVEVDPETDDLLEPAPLHPGATVLLSDGPWFVFPYDEQAMRVARNLARLIGRPWSEPADPSL